VFRVLTDAIDQTLRLDLSDADSMDGREERKLFFHVLAL
jgi:hypothetical protein